MVCAGVGVARADHVTGAAGDRGEERGEGMPLKDSAAGFGRREAWLGGVAEEPSDVLVGMGATGHHRMAPYAFLVSRGYSAAAVDPLQVRAVRRLRGLGRPSGRRASPTGSARRPRPPSAGCPTAPSPPCSPYRGCPTRPAPRSSPRSAT